MVAWFVWALIQIGATLLYELVRPKPKFDSPQPAGLDSFNFPTIGEGRPIPIAWGTVRQDGPEVVWFGDLEVRAIRKDVKTGLFSSDRIVIGYRYSLGVQMNLCSGPIDAVEAIYIDDKELDASLYTVDVTSKRTKLSINAPELFGGQEDGEGGIVGDVYVYHGTSDQDPDDYLEAVLGVSLPAYRGICYAVFRHVYLGTSPYLKKIGFRLRRIPNGLGLTGGDEEIAGDANPAAMIHDLLTASVSSNGLGLPAGFLDTATFLAVGAVLAGEGMGLSMIQDQATSGRDLVYEILRHVDGDLYQDPQTGLVTPVLMRADYDPGTVPILNETNCTVTAFARPNWHEIKNAIKLTYTDRDAEFTERTVQLYEEAAIAIAGGEVNEQELSYRGFSNADAAQQAGARAMAALCSPLATATIEANRAAWALRIGTPFKLNWSPLGIAGLIMRVVKINLGTLLDGKIRIEAVEDGFGVGWTGYAAPPPSAWEDPLAGAPALLDYLAIPAPHEATKDLQPAPIIQTRALVLATPDPTAGLTTSFDVSVDLGAGYGDPILGNVLCPSGVLDSSAYEGAVTLDVQVGPGMTQLASATDSEFAAGVNVALVVSSTSGLEEFIAFRDVTDLGGGVYRLSTLARGCIDTAPQPLAAGDRLYFVSYGFGAPVDIKTPDYLAGPPPPAQNTNVRFRGSNNRLVETWLGPLVVPSSWPDRAYKAYCPTDLQVNNASYPLVLPPPDELSITWEHRNKDLSWSYADSGKTVYGQPGTTYEITIWGELGTIVHTEPGIFAKKWTYDELLEIAESGLGRLNNHLKVQVNTWISQAIYGVDASTLSYQGAIWEFDRP